LFKHLKNATQWIFWLFIVASAIGSACAFFLWSLYEVTHIRWAYPWLLYGLPLGGLLVALLYHHYGASVEGGTNLILDEIHQPGGGIPKRMTPLVLLGTLIAHLFGGSVGREGTAVQMGGSIASAFARFLKFKDSKLRILLMSGIAAGFAGVFGTPLAGAIFAVEVLAIGKTQWNALLSCLIAAYIGDWACSVWHIHHTQYVVSSYIVPNLNHIDFVVKVLLASILFGLTSKLFSEFTHNTQYYFKRIIPIPYLRPFVGGLMVIGLTYCVGTHDYLGLGISNPNPYGVSILKAFHDHLPPWAWLLKLLFTVITIGSGFKGGEVTPLFFIGATLGNALAWALNAPPDIFAALGFIAVFAAAANTPLACTVMGIELFGPENGLYFALSCFLAFVFSGHSGIYLSQKIAKPKLFTKHSFEDTGLRDVQERKRLKGKPQI
jgi:H+/Cl- antiporter ClcA